MTSDRYIRDPAHGQPIPNGAAIATLLRHLLPNIETDARKQIGQGRTRPDLSRWHASIITAATPFVLNYWLTGYRQQATEILRVVARHQALRKRAKSILPTGRLDTTWDLFRPEVTAYVQQATFAFAESTLATIAHGIDGIQEAVRLELGEGLSRGEGTKEINARMGKLFMDPMRAARIGQSEASRAMHNGSMMAAHQSGVASGLEWLASSDCCPLCAALAGKQVKFGEPFHVDPKGGPYAATYHPPRHPHCACSTMSVIDLHAAERIPLDTLRGMANLGRVASRLREGTATIGKWGLR